MATSALLFFDKYNNLMVKVGFDDPNKKVTGTTTSIGTATNAGTAPKTTPINLNGSGSYIQLSGNSLPSINTTGYTPAKLPVQQPLTALTALKPLPAKLPLSTAKPVTPTMDLYRTMATSYMRRNVKNPFAMQLAGYSWMYNPNSKDFETNAPKFFGTRSQAEWEKDLSKVLDAESYESVDKNGESYKSYFMTFSRPLVDAKGNEVLDKNGQPKLGYYRMPLYENSAGGLYDALGLLEMFRSAQQRNNGFWMDRADLQKMQDRYDEYYRANRMDVAGKPLLIDPDTPADAMTYSDRLQKLMVDSGVVKLDDASELLYTMPYAEMQQRFGSYPGMSYTTEKDRAAEYDSKRRALAKQYLTTSPLTRAYALAALNNNLSQYIGPDGLVKKDPESQKHKADIELLRQAQQEHIAGINYDNWATDLRTRDKGDPVRTAWDKVLDFNSQWYDEGTNPYARRRAYRDEQAFRLHPIDNIGKAGTALASWVSRGANAVMPFTDYAESGRAPYFSVDQMDQAQGTGLQPGWSTYDTSQSWDRLTAKIPLEAPWLANLDNALAFSSIPGALMTWGAHEAADYERDKANRRFGMEDDPNAPKVSLFEGAFGPGKMLNDFVIKPTLNSVTGRLTSARALQHADTFHDGLSYEVWQDHSPMSEWVSNGKNADWFTRNPWADFGLGVLGVMPIGGGAGAAAKGAATGAAKGLFTGGVRGAVTGARAGAAAAKGRSIFTPIAEGAKNSWLLTSAAGRLSLVDAQKAWAAGLNYSIFHPFNSAAKAITNMGEAGAKTMAYGGAAKAVPDALMGIQTIPSSILMSASMLDQLNSYGLQPVLGGLFGSEYGGGITDEEKSDSWSSKLVNAVTPSLTASFMPYSKSYAAGLYDLAGINVNDKEQRSAIPHMPTELWDGKPHGEPMPAHLQRFFFPETPTNLMDSEQLGQFTPTEKNDIPSYASKNEAGLISLPAFDALPLNLALSVSPMATDDAITRDMASHKAKGSIDLTDTSQLGLDNLNPALPAPATQQLPAAKVAPDNTAPKPVVLPNEVPLTDLQQLQQQNKGFDLALSIKDHPYLYGGGGILALLSMMGLFGGNMFGGGYNRYNRGRSNALNQFYGNY